jgi:hypothetical protein
MDFDRSEVVAIILEEYLEKNEMFRSWFRY